MILNLTPHTVVLYREGRPTLTFKPEAIPARVSEYPQSLGEFEGCPLTMMEFGELTGLPDYEEGVLLIVSSMVRKAIDRDDLVSPSDMVRDGDGNILGCRALTF